MPPMPSPFSRLWSGPATNPPSEIEMWQVVLVMSSLTGELRRTHRARRVTISPVSDRTHGSRAGSTAWHRPLHHTAHGELDPDTAQPPGMRRFEALSARHGGTRRIWMGENHVGPELNSGDHHHGEAETGIYVVSGHPEFVFLDDERTETRIRTTPGDYVFVPPWVPPGEENPHPEPGVVVPARATREGIVVTGASLWAEDEIRADEGGEACPPSARASGIES